MDKLTDKQCAVFAFIRAYQKRTGNSPTFREISEHAGWGSATSAASHVNALKRKGWLKAGKGISLPDGVKPSKLDSRARNRVLDKLTQLGQEMGDYE